MRKNRIDANRIIKSKERTNTVIDSTIEPITPSEAKEARISSIEPEMIKAVNNLIIRKLDSTCKYASFKQDDVVAEYFKVKGIDETPSLRRDLFERHQLDFEDIFRKNGWSVKYDKPAYFETYDAYFEFTKK